MRRLAISTLVLLALPVMAGTMVRASGGCQVEVPSVRPGEVFAWSGTCKAGRAGGMGVVTSSSGGYLQGLFNSGEIADASGRWPLDMKSGERKLLAQRYSKSGQYIGQLFLQGRHSHYSVLSADPLVGTWRLQTPDGSCRELHVYEREGITKIESGEERLTRAFALLKSDQDGELAFLSTSVSTNGKPDCGGGSSSEVGTTQIEALKQIDSRTFELCDISDRSKCGATLIKVER